MDYLWKGQLIGRKGQQSRWTLVPLTDLDERRKQGYEYELRETSEGLDISALMSLMVKNQQTLINKVESMETELCSMGRTNFC